MQNEIQEERLPEAVLLREGFVHGTIELYSETKGNLVGLNMRWATRDQLRAIRAGERIAEAIGARFVNDLQGTL